VKYMLKFLSEKTAMRPPSWFAGTNDL